MRRSAGGLFIRDDSVISLSLDGGEASLVRVTRITPARRSYGEFRLTEAGKTDIVGRGDSALAARAEIPYSSVWVFRKSADPSQRVNELILERDVSDEDMLKVVELLSDAEFRVLR